MLTETKYVELILVNDYSQVEIDQYFYFAYDWKVMNLPRRYRNNILDNSLPYFYSWFSMNTKCNIYCMC